VIFPVIADNFDWKLFAASVLGADHLTEAFRQRLHLEWTVRGHHIRATIADDGLLADFLRRGLPAYIGGNQVLYRGENLDRWAANNVGFCWSTNEATARMFGQGLNLVSRGGVLLRTTAPIPAIIAGTSHHSQYLGEREFTVDSALLDEVSVVECFDPVSRVLT
jgi:hypothetical protein